MGVNYYLKTPNGKIYHIGKKSLGERFIFDCSEIDIKDWLGYIFNAEEIFNEYGKRISLFCFINTIRMPGKVPYGALKWEHNNDEYYYIKKSFI